MAIRNIVVEGDEILRKKCREVKEVTDHIRLTMQDMLDTMHQENGVGIAAPQIGVLRRMFIAEPAPGEVYYMINPVILESSGGQLDDEGCLSVPGLVGTVERPSYVKIQAMDLDGETKVYEFNDFHARVMCHENDHLDGTLYIDKASNIRDAAEAYDEEYDEEFEEE